MTLTLQDCAGGFEARPAHDHELKFRATARRGRLFARRVSVRKAVGAHHGGMSPADLQAGRAACAVQAWKGLLTSPQVTSS